MPAICKMKGCEAPAIALGLCATHYQQDRRGNLGETAPRSAPGEGSRVSFRIPANVREKLEHRARRRGISLSALCRNLVTETD